MNPLSTLLDHLPAGAALFDEEHRMVVANHQFAELLQLPAELCKNGVALTSILRYQIDRGDFESTVSGENVDALLRAVRASPGQGLRCRAAGQGLRALRCSAANDGALALLVTSSPPSSQGQREEPHQATVNRNILETIDQGIVIVDERMRVVGCNRQFVSMFELPLELVGNGTSFHEVIRHWFQWSDLPEDRLAKAIENTYLREQTRFAQTQSDGRVIEVEHLPRDDGWFVRTFTDVTERRGVESVLGQRLREAELMHRVVDLTAASSSVEDALQRALKLISTVTKWPVGHVYILSDADPVELESSSIWYLEDSRRFDLLRETVENTELELDEGLVGQVLETGKPLWVKNLRDEPSFSPLNKDLDLDLGVKSALAFPVKAAGVTRAVVEFFIEDPIEPDTALLDILASVGEQLGRVFERMQSERAHTDTQALLNNALQIANLGYWSWDAQSGRLFMVSEACQRILGLPADFMTHNTASHNETIAALTHPEDRVDYERFLDSLRAGQTCSLDYRIVRPDGELRSLRVVAEPMVDESERYLRSSGIVQDVTAGQEDDTRFQMLLDSAPDATVIIDATGTIVEANRRASALFGHEREALLGANSETLFPQRCRALHREHLRGFMKLATMCSVLPTEQLFGVDGCGKEFPVEISLSSLDSGESQLVVATLRDITRRREAEAQLQAARDEAEQTLEELERAQAELTSKDKLASLGALTASIAHEMKSPLNLVTNFSKTSIELLDELALAIETTRGNANQAMMDDVDELLDTLKSELSTISSHSHRADDIMSDVLVRASEESALTEVTDLNALVQASLELARDAERARNPAFDVELQSELDPKVAQVGVQPQALNRVMMNLLSNAFYATDMRRSGQANDAYVPAVKLMTRRLSNGVEIRVTDNGVGMPRETLDRLFKPFFTTKPAGVGAGLGLSLCYDIIVEGHGGSLTAKSALGDFSEFTIVIPDNTVRQNT